MTRNDVRDEHLLQEIRIIVSKEVQPVAAGLTSLTRTVDRIDQRLVDVEQHVVAIQSDLVEMKRHTDLIPGIAEAIDANSADLDNHEKRLKKLEKVAA